MAKHIKISEYVRDRRGDKTVLDYSNELGISNTQLARIEKGFWDNPSPTQVNNLCKYFDLELEDLDIFNIPEDTLYRSVLYKQFELEDIIHRCISNFYNNAVVNGEKFSDLYKEPDYENPEEIVFDTYPENIDAVCMSKKNKSDFVPFYYVNYHRTKEDREFFFDYDGIVRKYFQEFAITLPRILLNCQIKKAIIITNSKSSYDILFKWFTEIPCKSINKEIILAYCSIKNKGCEYYYKKIV